MIRIRSTRHLGEIFRALREGRGITRPELAARIHVQPKTIYDRERGHLGIPMGAALDTAAAFGFDVVLVPRPDPERVLPRGWRSTGTGWPA